MRQKLLRLMPLVVLIIVLWIGFSYTKSKESFDNPSVDKTFFNRINNLFNPVMPHRITAEDMNKATQVRRATNQPYVGDAYEKTTGQSNTKAGTIYESSDAIEKAQTICEVVVTEDCNAFDNPDFAEYCGISLKDPKQGALQGKNSKGKNHVGGLYIDPAYKESIPLNGTFYPTFGTSDNFAINKDTCVYMKNDLACKNNIVAIGTNNCTMCFSTGKKHAIKTGNSVQLPGFTFFTNASDLELKINSTSYRLRSSKSSIPLSANVILGADVKSSTEETLKSVRISNVDVREGQSIIITASDTNTDKTVVLAGYLEGLTRAGNTPLQMDINNLIDTDNGGTPLVGGTASGYLIIQQNYNKDNANIKLNGIMPFTFFAIGEPDTDNCKNGPFITTEAGANYIAQGEPCYGPDAQEGGVYSKACLQHMFLGAGGTIEGKGYPTTDSAAALLNSQGSGTLNDIGNYLYDMSVLASTGLTRGQKSTDPETAIDVWNEASLFMTGKAITNPCQTSDRKKGISQKCHEYLYEQSGCLERGTYNPKKSGYTRPTAIQTTKKPSDVSDFYATEKQKADNSGLSNRDRAAAYLGCYGVTLLQQ